MRTRGRFVVASLRKRGGSSAPALDLKWLQARSIGIGDVARDPPYLSAEAHSDKRTSLPRALSLRLHSFDVARAAQLILRMF